MPPGEEGFDLSHAGGEHEVFEEFAYRLAGPKYLDHRDRHDRVELRNIQWAEQYTDLVDAYLVYGLHECDGLVSEDMAVEGESNEFAIEVVDIFGRAMRTFAPLPTDIYHNTALIRHGYIGASPIRPTVAISIRTLAVYRQTHRTCPQLSIQAEVRKLCHLHKVPYCRYLCEQFTIAYDVYLEICYRVGVRVRTAMKEDYPHAELLNLCPACTYKLQDEPPLECSLHCEMDGNNSLKRIDAVVRERRERIDTRGPRGPFWISRDDVDRFKDDVKRSPGNSKDAAEDDSADQDADDDWQDEPGSEDPVATCIERWRNAGPEQRKRMFALFEESGIFVMACRNGAVLLLCDMVRSGEL
ncbi:hypothetical protein NEOLEDRAFT_1080998 [Neolentinus lepideus HHB14362 ss-1]|uniref:CxC1-like cysteine cluster associated with KDZ transposases domain-containing protein n=1 Tax=Neolentinus lepideus HHB14362 ss-1 TaxID=1314782 RepID=A0A165MAH1_9AGAM|nr:hypothetical protein NEOLEDRAFT_1080998 [Neolentinus lepideus HHB14362 ss-1]